MPRRLRRLAVLPVLPLVLAATLAACGDEDSGSGSGSAVDSGPTATGFDAVTISGEPPKAPEVTWKQRMSADGVDTKVLAEGDGPKIEKGDQVSADIWLGNGVDEKQVYSSFDKGGQPQTLTVDASMSKALLAAFEDRSVGSRVAVVSSAADAFGPDGNPQLQIGNEDSVLIVVDILKKIVVLDGPQGTKQPAPSWAPDLTEKSGDVTGLDFSGTPKPDGKLRSAALIAGNGPKVQSGQTITVDYLGQVYKAKKPFDDSYSKGQPASFPIGVGQVVSGWDKTLVGARVGSRMILEIPPAEGYGTQGNAQAGIKGTDTLYFVVDILSAS